MTKKINFEKRLEKLRSQIPGFECKAGCFACCGPVPVSAIELQEILECVGEDQERLATTLYCPYLEKNDRCLVYECRPIMCRLFGAVENLKCPYGAKPEKMLTKEEGKKILNEYFSFFRIKKH